MLKDKGIEEMILATKVAKNTSPSKKNLHSTWVIKKANKQNISSAILVPNENINLTYGDLFL